MGLILVVIAAHSSSGQQRLATLAGNAPKSATELAVAEQQKRLADNELWTRRLAEMIRSLGSDRELLLQRIALLEQNLDDVTGSIRRQAQSTPQPEPQTLDPLTTGEPTLTVTEAKRPTKAASEPQVATAPSPPPNQPPSGSKSNPPIGADVGGATNFDGLRKLWNAISTAHEDIFEGLHPVASVRENAKTRAPDLRLVVGPLHDADAAAEFCAALAAAKRYCRQAPFEGQRFSLAATESPRRPKAQPERKTPRPTSFPNP